MKSALLVRQLREIFGVDGEPQLRQLLAAVAGKDAALAKSLERLLVAADNTYTQYASLQHWQAEISGETYSDWNMKTGQVESGRQWKGLLGYEAEDIGNSLSAWQQLLHPDDLRVLQSRIAAHVQGGEKVFDAECRMRNKSGNWVWVLLRGLATARDANGDPLRMLVLHRDIGDAKETEVAMRAARDTAESASRARGAFLANMSHEIRTPLNGIIGMTELALDTELDAEQRHYLKTVKSSADSLLRIVNDILDFSKIEAGKMQFEAIAFSLHEVIFDAVRVLTVGAHKKGLEVIVDIAPDVPARAIGDPVRLRQVLTNLLGNAIKFTERGEVCLEVLVEKFEGNIAHLCFVVRDTGIGIPLDKQQAIFEAFSQADVSTTRRFGGTGLGLAICQRLVQLMEGQMWLESVDGQGTSFYFSVPLACEALVREAVFPLGLQGKRVLVIEDNLRAAAQLGDFLREIGVQASVLAHAAEAHEAIEQSRLHNLPFDFILLDASMPDPGGFALAEAWRSSGRRERLVVLITAENQRTDLARLRELGVRAHLVKPVGRQDLIEALLLAMETVEVPEIPQGKQAAGASVELCDFQLDDALVDEPDGLEILLAEDNPVNQELAAKLLQKLHHRVTIANNGAEAVDWFENKRFDVILMDMQMPVMGGLEATEAIRAREMRRSWVMSDDLKTAYIIAMTANTMEGDRDKCLQAGMNDFLSKPLTPGSLEAVLKKAIGEEVTATLASLGTGLPVDELVLDIKSALKNLGDRDLLVHMARMMLDEWKGNVLRIETALQSKQAQELRMHVHTLKGLLSIFHAERARRVAQELEKLSMQGGDGLWGQCQQLFDRLMAELNTLKPEIKRFMRGESGF
ncbi:MAG: Response regulator receiver:ATP-binding region, ATPase-like:Histidine kinase N-terminal:Hpt [Proteobacteria bacterium]|nr:Response regulator receiver:ATP-binding region, ATPase-like:Histidine kinase N-terminal:Hpt [Pseudomonadota bacterium]